MNAWRDRSLLGAAAALFAALTVSAQVEVPRLSQSIEVRITNVDIVVTDSSGKRVHGLTRDDFDVYDDGKLQPITNFSEMIVAARNQAPSTTAAPTSPETTSASSVPPRHIIIFYDALSTTREDRRRLTPALVKLVRDLRAEDEAMVVSWNRTLRIVVPPTSDHALLEKGLERAAGEISLRSERQTLFGNIMGDVPNPNFLNMRTDSAIGAEQSLEARRRFRERWADLSESVRGLQGILVRLSGLQGRKALILVSSGLSFDLDLMAWLLGLDAAKLMKTLADSANAAGVPIYGIQAEGLHSGWSAGTRGEEVDWSSAGTPALQKIRAMGAGLDGLNYLATRTGGLASGNFNYFVKAVEQISADLGSYYSIGYRSPDATIDKQRTIEVRTRDKRYSVRSRHSTIDRSAETEISDRVLAALLFPSSLSNQLGISARATSVEHRRNRMKVPVDVKIPMANLTYQSDGGTQLAADLSILIASADTTGSVSTVERFHHTIPITRPQLPTLATKFYTYGLDVDLRTLSAENRFAIAVVDNVSKQSGLVTLDVKP